MTTVSLPWLDCPTCGDERAFEAPECLDGHATDCPDLACTSCGTAVVLGAAPLSEPVLVEIHAAA